MSVRWDCSHCGEPLHLAELLWRTEGGDPFCNSSSTDLIAEQYGAVLAKDTGQMSMRVKMHAPRSDWVHPAFKGAP